MSYSRTSIQGTNIAVFHICTRGIRTRHHRQYRPPYPFVYRGSTGHKTTGPIYKESYEWPTDQYPELSPKMKTKVERRTGYFKPNPSQLHDYTNVQAPGYVDPSTGEFVVEDEMKAYIVAPDLSNCELKPYVSYRADFEIEKLEEAQVKDEQEGTQAAEPWPPEPTTAQDVFDYAYRNKVQTKFKEGFYDDYLNADGSWKSAISD